MPNEIEIEPGKWYDAKKYGAPINTLLVVQFLTVKPDLEKAENQLLPSIAFAGRFQQGEEIMWRTTGGKLIPPGFVELWLLLPEIPPKEKTSMIITKG